MPKMKTHKGIQKRVKVTANKKIRYKKPGTSHLMSHQNGDSIRNLRRPGIMKGRIAEKMVEALHLE